MTILITSKNPLLNLSAEFAQLCKPLQPFHIHHVTYQKHYKDGTRISLSSNPRWIEDYYNLKLYESSLFESQKKLTKPLVGIWIGEYDLEVYRYGLNHYNTGHSISITESVDDGMHSFLFAASPKHAQAIHYLANNIEILYHFILYLKDRGRKIFQTAMKHKIILPNFSSTKHTEELIKMQDYFKEMENAKEIFFKTTAIYRYAFEQGENKGIEITRRELECISHLLSNKSAPEMAKLMNISSRTAEYYLDNIKAKLNCNSKQELLYKIKQNPLLNAIS